MNDPEGGLEPALHGWYAGPGPLSNARTWSANFPIPKTAVPSSSKSLLMAGYSQSVGRRATSWYDR